MIRHALWKASLIKLDVAKFGGAESDKLLHWGLQVSTAADTQRISDKATCVAFAMSHLKGRAESWAFSERLTDPHCFPSFAIFNTELEPMFLPTHSDFPNVNDEESLPESLRVTVFMDDINQGPAPTQPQTFEEAVRIALSESFSSIRTIARVSIAVALDTFLVLARHLAVWRQPRLRHTVSPVSHLITSRVVLRAVHLTASVANAMAPRAGLSAPFRARVRREKVALSRREATYTPQILWRCVAR
ncbi:hypothetical protein H257_06650 [Aphanomyces astaci]|uniref:Uncharacterized protein n=1 Tax=Aphanomyces astaci TaxID=112090 RepID=W4GN59_APHAT|nr:hypothetical protein H257_06650 [Aphanomyces astaci]ETV80338.1 hypothetical protein H257_06650 [Aphanomyces astaci]|eukprot:XP_009830262.1 hypothetical protein H257_06650 [Aphanomyces astaci]